MWRSLLFSVVLGLRNASEAPAALGNGRKAGMFRRFRATHTLDRPERCFIWCGSSLLN